jgi:Zn-dependent protease with chaperone function
VVTPPTAGNTQWQDHIPRWMIVAGLVGVAMVIAAYIYGIPMLARFVAERFPASVVARIDSETLAALDRQVFAPSALPRERQHAIATAFRNLKMPHGASAPADLLFRKSEALGANAMALPGGTIVVTDGLVALARDDREILGVLAHEAGHVASRHGLRGIVQDSLVSMLLALAIGDISALAAAASSSVLEASYSRDLEREADAFAIETLNANGIPLTFLANMLRRLDSAAGASGMPNALRYLSTHPATDERIRQLDAVTSSPAR